MSPETSTASGEAQIMQALTDFAFSSLRDASLRTCCSEAILVASCVATYIAEICILFKQCQDGRRSLLQQLPFGD